MTLGIVWRIKFNKKCSVKVASNVAGVAPTNHTSAEHQYWCKNKKYIYICSSYVHGLRRTNR